MAMTVRDTAVAARKAGIVVLPAAADGSKRPALAWQEYQQRQPTDAELSRWFPKDGGPEGIGFICGTVSGGLELLEFEDAASVVEFKMLAKEAGLWPLVSKIEMGYCEETPGGGVHWLYRVPEPLPNTKLAAMPCPETCDKHETGTTHVLIETRGEGGWVVVAPSNGSTHPSGRPYVLRAGGLPIHTMLTTEERDTLFDLARSLDRMPKREFKTSSRPVDPATVGTRPGDLWAAATDWPEILRGFTYRFQHGPETYWARPGAKTHGHDVTTNYRGSDLMYVFSSSVAGFEPDTTYSKFATFAILNHGGDFGAAARDLVSKGYGNAGGEVTIIKAAPRVDAPQKPQDAGYCFEHIFPEGHFIRRYIEYASSLTDAPWEYHEALAAALVGIVTPGVRVELTAWPRGLATNVYVALVGDSTRSRKSTATGYAKAMLARVDAEAQFPDKFSAEAMLEQLAMRSGKASAWFPDEIGKVLEDMERKPQLEDALLTLYDGPQSYDYARHSKRIRGGMTVSDHDIVEHPHWNVIGATTESIFDTLSPRMVQSGLMPRFAYVWPRERPERMGLRRKTPDMEREAQRLAEYLSSLRRWAAICEGAAEVEFSDEAIDIIDEFMVEIEATGQTITARLPAMAVKLAMISSLGVEIPAVTRLLVMPEDARRAVALARKWKESALRFGVEIGGFTRVERVEQQRMEKALLYVRQHGGRASRSEIIREIRVNAKVLDEFQRTLIEAGKITVEQEESAGGRSPTYWVLT
jgi:hypothetical protein